MSDQAASPNTSPSRRDAFRIVGGVAGLAMAATTAKADAVRLTEEQKLDRLASNTYPIRRLFARRSSRQDPKGDAMKKKYGTITLLDFPEFTQEHFPGVRHMDLWSSLFGDQQDDSMYEIQKVVYSGREREIREFDPAAASAKKWLDRLRERIESTGVHCHHVSNNAPRGAADLDPEQRKTCVETAKKWLDAAAHIGAKSMRVNTGGPRIAPAAVAPSGYPRNEEIEKYFANAIDTFRQMAEYGEEVGVKVTIENHWGLSANAMHIRIILDEVNHPYCEASPDFCNWEHKYMLYHGLSALMPYTHTTVHAKYWDRWDSVDIARCVDILHHGGFRGKIALEYEQGPWDGVEGAKRLMKDVLAAL